MVLPKSYSKKLLSSFTNYNYELLKHVKIGVYFLEIHLFMTLVHNQILLGLYSRSITFICAIYWLFPTIEVNDP